MKNCITYLVRASDQDIDHFNRSLDLIEKNLLPFCRDVDIIVFHEKDLAPFKNKISSNIPLIFKEIEFILPEYNKDIKDEIPEFYPHPTHGNGPIAYGHKGFPMGYRHMCRFFFSEIFNHISEYKTYMRLDTDSFILDPVNHDIFEWFNTQGFVYSYIAPAIQIDEQKVCEGLNEVVNKWIKENNIQTISSIDKIPNGTLYYTNFEIGNIQWFLEDEKVVLFSKFINDSGKIFSKRWGDAPLRYLQINLFCEKNKISPVHGIHYQHGATYQT